MVKMGTVWDRTAEFLSDNVAAIVPIALIAFFVPASVEGNFESVLVGASPATVLVVRLVQVAFGVLSLWGSLAVIAMALDLMTDRTAGAIATQRLPAAVAVSLALLLGMLLLALPIPIAIAASGADLMAIASGTNFNLDPSVAIFVGIYGVLLAIAVIWLGARFAVTTPAVVREKQVFGALGRSWRLTRGAALGIVGVILLYTIVSWVAQLAAQMVFGSIFGLVAGGSDAAGGLSLAGVLTAIVVAAVQTAFMVIVPAFLAKLYLALAAREAAHPMNSGAA
jgi:hypothetical protein